MAGVLSAFATRNRLRASILALGFALLIGGSFAAVEAQRLAPLIQSMGPRFAASVYWNPMGELASYLTPLIVGLVNCLILRHLGYRLIRPGAGSPSSLT